MTRDILSPTGHVEGKVGVDHAAYVQGALQTLGSLGIEAGILEGGNGLELDTPLTARQAALIVESGLYAVRQQSQHPVPELATVADALARREYRVPERAAA